MELDELFSALDLRFLRLLYSLSSKNGFSITSVFLEYLFKQAKRYNASEIKRFKKHKRYAVMVCFLLETR
ncbi:MAG: hypothetical protein AAFY76_12505, partial [Cyanobacteria bacterium J06649_11]